MLQTAWIKFLTTFCFRGTYVKDEHCIRKYEALVTTVNHTGLQTDLKRHNASRTTWPTTMTDGDSCSLLNVSVIVPTVALHTVCCCVPAHLITATYKSCIMSHR